SSMAEPNQAAWIWFFSIPASARASTKASTMRSSALRSQRSPKREQPIPRIATLSLIPEAMSRPLMADRRQIDRHSLPEIAAKITACVIVLDPEDHPHGHADVQVFHGVNIGEVAEQPAASVKLHKTVVGRRIGGEGETVSGE